MGKGMASLSVPSVGLHVHSFILVPFPPLIPIPVFHYPILAVTIVTQQINS